MSKDYKALLEKFITEKQLKHSGQRNVILEEILLLKQHFTIEELYLYIKQKHPQIGQATVYRAVRLFLECGICDTLIHEDGKVRYELFDDKTHHDHLFCVKCGKIVELSDGTIEVLQQKLAAEHGFELLRHKLEMYGYCGSCR